MHKIVERYLKDHKNLNKIQYRSIIVIRKINIKDNKVIVKNKIHRKCNKVKKVVHKLVNLDKQLRNRYRINQ